MCGMTASCLTPLFFFSGVRCPDKARGSKCLLLQVFQQAALKEQIMPCNTFNFNKHHHNLFSVSRKEMLKVNFLH
jgi:hypothetical protein